MADLVGQQLGNYHLVRLLGKGAFAEVYLGRHVLLETQAAIKVLHTKLTNDELEGFLTEARILRRLEHSHIVRVLDFAVEDGSPFLVMEYAPYGTLRQRHPQSAPIPLDTIVSYVKQVVSALQYAHDARLIHRDVKPENMLVGKRHEVLLSDLALSPSLRVRVLKMYKISLAPWHIWHLSKFLRTHHVRVISMAWVSSPMNGFVVSDRLMGL
jgi:eukaryotic-like serine/threonine-protein kinase